MGAGEYTDDANKRTTAMEFRETAAEYSTRGYRQIKPGLRLPQSDFTPTQDTGIVHPTIRHFVNYGIEVRDLYEATQFAQLSGKTAGEELIRGGVVSPSQFAEITASHIQVEFVANGPNPQFLTQHTLRLSGIDGEAQPVEPGVDFSEIAIEYANGQNNPSVYLACDPAAIEAIENIVNKSADDYSQIKLTTRKALHNSQFIAKQATHLNNAIYGLFKNFPSKSAATIITSWQILAVLIFLSGSLAAFYFWPIISMIMVHILSSFFYISVTLMRAGMIITGADILTKSPTPILKSATGDRQLPLYTISVAFYKEAGQVDDLAASLSAIDWPADRLQILFICEADDPETIAKCFQYSSDDRFQTVVCPPAHPRTKPKALNFALPLAKGEMLVLYDAEDCPHPDQLREAHGKFSRDDTLGCLQAPLFVHNDRQSWFTRMFAIEYTTLFGLMLPVLERWRAPIPLGGTSNHFRTKILREIGAWDPFNVTEDADLGIRLARTGYHCGTITLPTMEEAPPVFDVWFKQRTRWIKGWIQTLLVHTRNPVSLMRELGWHKSIYFHLIMTSIVVSALIHPFFIASSIYYGAEFFRGATVDKTTLYILGIDAFNLVGAYSTYFAVAILALDAKHKSYLRRSIIWIPFYWILMSLAGWRAIVQLFYAPFHWEKTRHGLADGHSSATTGE